MDTLKAMQVFIKVIELNGFSKAAKALQLPSATVTRHVQDLEAWLDTTLVSRTTRRLQVTATGEEFLRRASQLIDELGAIEASLAGMRHAPRGDLKVQMGAWFARAVVIPNLEGFRESFPGIRVSLHIGDESVDPVELGLDCVIRTGELKNSSLIGKRVGSIDLLTVASPEYLRRTGIPRNPLDLAAHEIVGHVRDEVGRGHALQFAAGMTAQSPVSSPSLLSNDRETILHACLCGFGLAQVPALMAQPYLQTGDLLEVMPSHRPPSVSVFAVLPPGRRISPVSRAFTTWLSEAFPEQDISHGVPPGFALDRRVQRAAA